MAEVIVRLAGGEQIVSAITAESAKRLRGDGDRIESEDEQFRARVDDAYRQLAEAFPQRITPIDGTRSPDEIAREILDELRERS